MNADLDPDEPMVLVGIFERPQDYPQGYVVRCWYIQPGLAVPAEEADYFPSREQAREWVEKTHPEMRRMPPTAADVSALCDVYL